MKFLHKIKSILALCLVVLIMIMSMPVHALATDNQLALSTETIIEEGMNNEITEREKVVLGVPEKKKNADELLGVDLGELSDYKKETGSVDMQGNIKLARSGNSNLVEAQTWLNKTYTGRSGYTPLEVDGVSYSTTYIAFVKAFQIEMGLPLQYITGTFGDITKSYCPTFKLNQSSSSNLVTILQYALLCKGYYDVEITGKFDENTQREIVSLQEDAGLAESQISTDATPIVVQAALSTEIYVIAIDGDERVREIQRALNQDYFSYIGIQPCDGIFGPNTVKALIMALQSEEGIPRREDVDSDDDIYANGYFGSTTRRLCPSIPYQGAEKRFDGSNYTDSGIVRVTKILQYSLYCNTLSKRLANGIGKYDPGNFNGSFSGLTVTALERFQEDVALSKTGRVSLNEWMALMVSTGNPDRIGAAIDCSTRLTKEKCAALKNAGYTTVGRYLTGDLVIGGQRVAKNLMRSEMQTIFDEGLSIFAIYQDIRQFFAENPSIETVEELYKVYFSPSQGRADAEKAFAVAKSLGIPEGEVIYFAVDYDFVKSQVQSMVIPYFREIWRYAEQQGNPYRIGIYGARNTCTLVGNAGWTSSSFVSDMSTGYSGNLGYPLPDDWAFDQIKEFDFDCTDGSFGVDKNVMSGRYAGFNQFDETMCNEWDLLSKPASVYVAKAKNNSPVGIPVYWAKIDNGDGTFQAKYTMDDSILANGFYAMNLQANANSKDTIRHVYFRDKGGRINNGYIDTNNLKLFDVDYFQNTMAYEDGTIYTGANTEDYKYEYVLTKALKIYSSDGEYISTLAQGSKVRLSKNMVTHNSYINLIKITHKLVAGSNEWQNFDGYIDINFETGVLPENRALVSGDKASSVPVIKKKAIYFLPGFMGTQLWKSENDELAWVDIGTIVGDSLLRKAGFGGLFNLDEKGEGDKLKVSSFNDKNSGVFGTVMPGEGDSAAVIMNNLKMYFGAEYEVKFFCYDWRKSLKVAIEDLEKDIKDNRFEEVSFVCHSTGGLLCAAFINQNKTTRTTKIDKVVTLGSPLTGTYTALEVLETGNNKMFDDMNMIFNKEITQVGLNAIDIRGWAQEIVRNSPCIYQLLPSEELLNTEHSPHIYAEEIISNENDTRANTSKKFYNLLNRSLSNLNENMIDGDGESVKKYRKEYLGGKNIMDVYKEVNAYHIAGSGTQTNSIAKYKAWYLGPVQFDGFESPTLDGDGTSLIDSALGIYKNNQGFLVTPQNIDIFDGVEHFALVTDDEVFKSVEYFLRTGQVMKRSQTKGRRSSYSNAFDINSRLSIRINGKVDVRIVDSQEGEVGKITEGLFTCDDDQFYYNYVNEDTADLYIPRSGYKIKFISRKGIEDDVNFSTTIKTLNDEGLTSAAIQFDDIPALQDNDYILLDALQEINDSNLKNIKLCRNDEVEISHTNIKTNFAQLLELEEQKTIDFGSTVQLAYDVSPADISLIWSSSDESIATVDEFGKVTAVNYGYAQISANTADGNQVKICYVCVPYSASEISLDKEYKIQVGERLLLEPKLKPEFATNTEISYSIQDSNIAEVEDGLVIAKSSGETTITATTDNGKTTQCTLVVTDSSDSTTPIQYVTIGNPGIRYADVGDSIEYTATVYPKNADYITVKWQVDNKDVAVIEETDGFNCSVRAVGYGTTQLTVTVSDGIQDYTAIRTINIEHSNEVVVYYHNSKGWNKPYIYYKKSDSVDVWQIKPMLSSGDGWYVYTIEDTHEINALFYDNDSEQNLSEDQSYLITGEKWILKGEILSKKPDGIKVHYYCVNNWTDPHIYYYNDTDHELPFPGDKMSLDGGNNWYTYTIYGLENPRVIFNNNTTDPDTRQQHPGINQPGIEITEDEMWVVNETAYIQKPQGITVHFYRPADWEYWNTRIYFYEDNNILMEWPGTLMNSQMYDNWLAYTIYGIDNPKVIFNDSQNKQIPGVLQEGHLVTRDVWYKDGIWSTYKP